MLSSPTSGRGKQVRVGEPTSIYSTFVRRVNEEWVEQLNLPKILKVVGAFRRYPLW